MDLDEAIKKEMETVRGQWERGILRLDEVPAALSNGLSNAVLKGVRNGLSAVFGNIREDGGYWLEGHVFPAIADKCLRFHPHDYGVIAADKAKGWLNGIIGDSERLERLWDELSPVCRDMDDWCSILCQKAKEDIGPATADAEKAMACIRGNEALISECLDGTAGDRVEDITIADLLSPEGALAMDSDLRRYAFEREFEGCFCSHRLYDVLENRMKSNEKEQEVGK